MHRDYIVAATQNQPDAPAALNRLLRNQDGIVNQFPQKF